MIDLAGKTALVTGGTRNIGKAIGLRMAEAGATVGVIGGTSQERLDETIAELGRFVGEHFGFLCDIADADAITSTVAACVAEQPPIDILVNAAALRPSAPFTEVTLEEWAHVLDVNLRAPFLLAQRLMPGMMSRGFGRVINLGGLDTFWGKTKRPHVVASKGGLLGLTRALAVECAEDGVTVNLLVPGTIDSERHSPDWYTDVESFYHSRIERTPMRRLGKVSEVADVALFLASELSSYMTGQSVFVTGGAVPLVREDA